MITRLEKISKYWCVINSVLMAHFVYSFKIQAIRPPEYPNYGEAFFYLVIFVMLSFFPFFGIYAIQNVDYASSNIDEGQASIISFFMLLLCLPMMPLFTFIYITTVILGIE